MKLSIKVIPNAKQNKLIEVASLMAGQKAIKVYLTAPAVDGKANKALIDFLSEYYAVKKSSIKIVRGETSRNKIVDIG